MKRNLPEGAELIATNKKAAFEYKLEDFFEAGMKLMGTEIKAIRNGQVNMNDCYCYFEEDGLYVRSLFIGEYKHGNVYNHEPRRKRKLLLKKSELRKLEKRVKERGYSIIPYRVYISARGLAKLEIASAQGKKVHDKRDSLKAKDDKRQMERIQSGRY